MSLLACRNLSVGYDGKAVLENLNFSVESGEYLCVVGENGSGKSTLMKTLLGLQQPLSGQILRGDGLQKKRDRVSSPANGGAEGFPRFRAGDRSLRLPGAVRLAALL